MILSQWRHCSRGELRPGLCTDRRLKWPGKVQLLAVSHAFRPPTGCFLQSRHKPRAAKKHARDVSRNTTSRVWTKSRIEEASMICDWCDRSFRPRRGGSPHRFCGPKCRTAFWTALRRWGERAVAAGILTVGDIRSGDPAACTPKLVGRHSGRLSVPVAPPERL
jgi:hypothetical protein